MGRFHQVVTIDVRNKTEGHRPVAVVLEGFIGHDRSEVGTTDADVDDVAYSLAGVALLPCSRPHAVAKLRHPV